VRTVSRHSEQFYFVIPTRVSPIVIVIMYHLVPTPESLKKLVSSTVTVTIPGSNI
jgi:hypothetical protein